MDIKKYTDSLARQQAELKGYVSTSLAAVQLPASANDMKTGKKNFLTDSGWTFNVLGIIAFIIGLLIGVPGVWITGCAAVLAGCYCIVKGKQQLRLEAYRDTGMKLRQAVESCVAHISKTWTGFVTSQNDTLRRDIVASAMSDADKAKALGGISGGSWLHVDLNDMDAEIEKAADAEDVAAYRRCVPEISGRLSQAVDLAAKAQADVYGGLTAAN